MLRQRRRESVSRHESGSRGVVNRVLTAFLVVVLSSCRAGPQTQSPAADAVSSSIPLPEPITAGRMSLEEALCRRRSIRDYSDQPLALEQIAQVLWSAQGITDVRGYRTAPSAGALYPLHLYLVVGTVTGLDEGVYQYLPAEHALLTITDTDMREELAHAALGQDCISAGAACLVITATYERTTFKYGQRGERYVHMEAGHAAQNVYLECAALGLGTVSVGAFHDDLVRTALGLSEDETPLYLMPIGDPL